MESQDKTIPEGVITSVYDAIGVVKKLDNPPSWNFNQQLPPNEKYLSPVWYRGQSEDLDLIPKVFRPDKNNPFRVYDESSMFHNFKMRTYQEYRHEHTNVFEWLCLMQHYDLPTRLLDWTESILIALYFAVNTEKHWGKDGVIFSLYAPRLNQLTDIHEPPEDRLYGVRAQEDPEIILRPEMAKLNLLPSIFYGKNIRDCEVMGPKIIKLLKEITEFFYKHQELKSYNLRDLSIKAQYLINSLYKPTAIIPYRINKRMLAQYSLFTLHGGKIQAKEYTKSSKLIGDPIHLEELNKKAEEPFMKKYKVRASSKEKINHELNKRGIHEANLFPEVDRQAKYIKDCWWKEIGN